jgi:hypothetical protein
MAEMPPSPQFCRRCQIARLCPQCPSHQFVPKILLPRRLRLVQRVAIPQSVHPRSRFATLLVRSVPRPQQTNQEQAPVQSTNVRALCERVSGVSVAVDRISPSPLYNQSRFSQQTTLFLVKNGNLPFANDFPTGSTVIQQTTSLIPTIPHSIFYQLQRFINGIGFLLSLRSIAVKSSKSLTMFHLRLLYQFPGYQFTAFYDDCVCTPASSCSMTVL